MNSSSPIWLTNGRYITTPIWKLQDHGNQKIMQTETLCKFSDITIWITATLLQKCLHNIQKFVDGIFHKTNIWNNDEFSK